MSTESGISLSKLCEYVASDLDDMENNSAPEYESYADLLSDVAWDHVPAMNADVLRLALDDLTLGFPDDSGDAAEEVHRSGAYGVISWAIFERLYSHGRDHLWKAHGIDVDAGTRPRGVTTDLR